MIFGAIVAAVAAAIWLTIGEVYSSSETRQLYQQLSSSSLYFGSAVAGTSTTVITLMLATLSLTHRLDNEWGATVYRRLRITAIFAVVSLGTAIILLLIVAAPATQAESIPKWWFSYLFPMVYFIDAALAVLMVMTAGLLFKTVDQIICEISPNA